MFVNIFSFGIGLSAPVYTIPIYEFLVILNILFIKDIKLTDLLLIVALMGTALMSALFTPLMSDQIFIFLGLLCSFLVLWSMRFQLNLFLVFQGYALSCLVVSGLAVLDFLFRFTDGAFMYKGTFNTLRVSGNFQDPNFFACSCILSLIIFSRKKDLHWLTALLITIIFATAIALSQSRAGMLAFIFYLLLYNRLLFFCLLPLLLYVTHYSFEIELLPDLLARFSDTSSSGRVEIWLQYLDVMAVHPIGQFGYKPEAWKFTHNTFLQAIYHFGVISICLMFLLLVRLFQTRFKYSGIFLTFVPLLGTLDLIFTRPFFLLLLFYFYLFWNDKNAPIYTYNS